VATPTYQELWDKVLHSDDVDLFAARETAYSWHGGQNSALYSFASTDCTVWTEEHRASLIADVERCIRDCAAKPADFYPDWTSVDTYTREKFQSGTPETEWGSPADAGMDSLENLLRAIKALPAKG
jgi:hypothetical protein